MTERIALYEYESREVGLHPDDQSSFLADSNRRLTIVPTAVSGRVTINPNQYVGVMRLPSGIILDLLPKVPLFNVMWMIAEVERLEAINFDRLENEVTIKTFDDILEPIATAFVEEVERLIDRGLYRAYIEQHDNLSTIRGRIDFREDLNRNVVLRHRTYCRFTEYSWDVPENQVVRQVVRLLARWGLSSRLTSRLVALDRQLEDITLTQFRASDVQQFHYSRQSEHYRPVHRFCHLFLDGFSLSEGVGESPFDGFLMDMNKLFEQFVAIRLQQAITAIGPDIQLDRQFQTRLFHGFNRVIRPDLLLRASGYPGLVADTKYKRRSGADGSPDDYYQMITYCIVLGLKHGVLIYPRHQNPIAERLPVIGDNITIHEVSIDLQDSRKAIHYEFSALARRFIELCDPVARSQNHSNPHKSPNPTPAVLH